MSHDKKKPTDEDRQKAKEALEHELEILRKQAADACQRGDIAEAVEIEKRIAWIERGAKRGG